MLEKKVSWATRRLCKEIVMEVSPEELCLVILMEMVEELRSMQVKDNII